MSYSKVEQIFKTASAKESTLLHQDTFPSSWSILLLYPMRHRMFPWCLLRHHIPHHDCIGWIIPKDDRVKSRTIAHSSGLFYYLRLCWNSFWQAAMNGVYDILAYVKRSRYVNECARLLLVWIFCGWLQSRYCRRCFNLIFSSLVVVAAAAVDLLRHHQSSMEPLQSAAELDWSPTPRTRLPRPRDAIRGRDRVQTRGRRWWVCLWLRFQREGRIMLLGGRRGLGWCLLFDCLAFCWVLIFGIGCRRGGWWWAYWWWDNTEEDERRPV